MKQYVRMMAAVATAMFSVGALNAEELRNTQKPVDRLTWTDSSGKYWWKELHESFLQNVATNPTKKFDFVMIGDSITRNWAATSGTGYFTQQTCNLGKAVADQRFAGYRWLNLGIGGDGTSQVIWRIQNGDDLGNELEGFETGLISLMVGTNNRSDSAEDVALGIKTIIETIRARQPKAKILVNAILPRFPREDDPGYADNPQAMNVKNKATNDLIKEYCDGTNVIWFDWTAQLYKNEELDSTLYYDREHPAEGGYTIWATNLLPHIKAAAGSGSLPGGRLFHLKNGITDWTAGASYTEEVAPGEGDVIVVPDNATVYLNASTDSASLALVNKMRNVYLTGDESRVEINVAENDDQTVAVSISAYGYSGKTMDGGIDYAGGPIVKTGLGTLRLTSQGFNKTGSANIYDYYTAINAAEGTLYVQPGFGANNVHETACLGRVTVASGATLFLPYSLKTGAKGGLCTMRSLSGGGIVTNEVPMSLRFNGWRNVGEYGDFSGEINGEYHNIGVNSDAQVLSGTASKAINSTSTGATQDYWGFWDGGKLAAADFGHAEGETSSLGKYIKSQLWWMPAGGFTFEFVNAADTTVVHGFVFNSGTSSSAVKPAVFDAGARGGVTFTGQWQRMYSSGGGRNVILTGSNTTECVLNNVISDNTESAHANGRGHTLYIRKEGTGTWKVNEVSRTAFASGWSVDEGTLKFTSMAEKGKLCALGMATNLTDGTMGKTDTNAEHRVDYAIRLGAQTSSGTYKTSGRLEYAGTGVNTNWSRKVALAGEGGFTANGTTHHQIYGGGVTGISANPMKLHLDGDSTEFNLVTDIADGTAGGKVSVCKAGEGTWTLGGDLTFTGDIEVKGGTLVYRKPTQYTWFRWTIQELYYGESKNDMVQFYELGLYDAQGNWRNGYLTYDAANTRNGDYIALEPGEVAFNGSTPWAVSVNITVGSETRNTPLTLDRAFDNMYNGWGVWGVRYAVTDPDDSSKNCTPILSDPRKWFRFVMRLTNGTDVAGYDFANISGRWSSSGVLTTIKDCMMEGSLDGIHWDTLSELRNATNHWDGGMWVCQGGYADDNETATHGARLKGSFPGADNNYRDPKKMFPIAGAPAASALPTVNNPAGTVSVTGGATFKLEGVSGAVMISKLKADATSGGTIDGFAFAANGTLDITNCPQQGGTLPLTFANATGVANLANWSLTINGKTPKARNIKVTTDGKLEVQNTGLVLTLE